MCQQRWRHERTCWRKPQRATSRQRCRPVFSASASAAGAVSPLPLRCLPVSVSLWLWPLRMFPPWHTPCYDVFVYWFSIDSPTTHMTSRTCTSNQPARQASSDWHGERGGGRGAEKRQAASQPATKWIAINNGTQHAYYYCWSALWRIWRCCTHNLINLQWGNSIYNPFVRRLMTTLLQQDTSVKMSTSCKWVNCRICGKYWTRYWGTFEKGYIGLNMLSSYIFHIGR